jgi:hypothetical protein
MQTQTAIAPSVPAPEDSTVFHRIWPASLILFGMALNIVWLGLLGYGLLSMIKMAF